MRQDEAELQAKWRRQKRFNYVAMAVAVGFMVFFLLILSTPQLDDVSGWDYAVGVAGERMDEFGAALRDEVGAVSVPQELDVRDLAQEH